MSDLLNSASLVMIPSGYKEDVVYSQIPTNGNGDLSFTRASNGTRVNSAGLVEVVPWNLVEYSETFDNVAWIKSNANITANNTTAPNGTATADKIAANGTLTSSYFGVGKSITNNIIGQNYTETIYVKAGTITQMMMYLGSSNGIYWNLSNGQFISYYSGVQNIIAYNSEAVGDGWYKYTITINAPNTTIDFEIYGAKSGAFIGNYTTADNYYLWGAQLNIGSTAKPYFPTTDRQNVPRLTYQNGGGGCPSLLLEKQSTNEANYSQQFDDSYWAKNNQSVTANATTSPDGTQNADLLIPSAGSGDHYLLSGTISNVSGQVVTLTLFVKKKENDYFYFGTGGASAFGAVVYQFSTNTFVVSGLSATATNFGNGWIRLSITGTTGATDLRFLFTPTDSTGSRTYNANGTDGTYIWGAQAEASSYPTSYIPTTSSSATRVADFATTNNISSLFGSTEGSFFIEMTYDNSNASGAIPLFLRSSANAAYNYATYLQFGGGTVQFYVYDSGSSQASMTSSAIYTTGQKLKIAFAYKQNDFVIYVNGVQIGTDANGSISTSLAFIDLGTYNQVADTYRYNGAISEAVLFPTRLTNAELASLTTI